MKSLHGHAVRQIMITSIILINTDGCLNICLKNKIMKINGLTARQAKLLEKLSNIEYESEMEAWMITLPSGIVDEVHVLIELVILEAIEAVISDMDGKYPKVFNMIMKCKKK